MCKLIVCFQPLSSLSCSSWKAIAFYYFSGYYLFLVIRNGNINIPLSAYSLIVVIYWPLPHLPCHLFSLPQNPHSFNDFSYGSHHISDNTVTYFFAYFDPVFPRWNNQNCSVQLMHICHEVIQGITKPCFLMYFFPKILLFWTSVKTQIMIPESIQRCQSSIFPKNFYLNVLTIQYAHISYMHTKLLNKTLNSSDICTDCSIITLMFMKWRPVITCCGHMNWCIFLPLSPKAWK